MPGSTELRIAAAARKILEQEGAEAVSMRRVAADVGITAMAIYRHFPGRDALLAAVADAGFEALSRQYKESNRRPFKAQLSELMEKYLDFALKHPRLFEYMFLSPRKEARRFPADFIARRSPTANILADLVKRAIDSRELKEDDAWEVALSISAEAHGLIILYLAQRFDLPENKFRALYRRSLRRLLDGISI